MGEPHFGFDPTIPAGVAYLFGFAGSIRTSLTNLGHYGNGLQRALLQCVVDIVGTWRTCNVLMPIC